MFEYFRIAFKNLKEKKVRGWLTLIGILIGVTAVVALIGLGDGLSSAINGQFGVSSTEVISIQAGGVSAAGPPGSGVTKPLVQDDVDAINRLGVVEITIPRIIQTGKLEYNDKLIFGFAMSVPDGDARDFAYEAMDFKVEDGRLLKDGDNKRVVLGYNYKDNAVGLDTEVLVGDSVFIQGEKFEVVGITKKKGSFIFDNVVHMNEQTMKDLFKLDDSVDVIVAKIKDKSLMEQAKLDIEKVMRKQRNIDIGDEDFRVQTPDQMLENVNQILFGIQIFILIIASISILVGSIGIVNTMLTSVLERKRDIGIMKSIGATNYDIFMLFFIESGILGFVGGLIGVTLGTLISYAGTVGINNFLGSTATPSISFTLIFLTLLGSFVIGSVSGIVPALKAARQNPVDALRG